MARSCPSPPIRAWPPFLGKLALYQLSYVRRAAILSRLRTRSSRSLPPRSEHIQNIGAGPRQPASLQDVVLNAPMLTGLGVNQVMVGDWGS
jgi:hypothetical protein